MLEVHAAYPPIHRQLDHVAPVLLLEKRFNALWFLINGKDVRTIPAALSLHERALGAGGGRERKREEERGRERKREEERGRERKREEERGRERKREEERGRERKREEERGRERKREEECGGQHTNSGSDTCCCIPAEAQHCAIACAAAQPKHPLIHIRTESGIPLHDGALILLACSQASAEGLLPRNAAHTHQL